MRIPPLSLLSRAVLIVSIFAAWLGGGATMAETPSLSIIHTFQSNSTGPFGKKSKLLQGPSAVFYGTSQSGGTNAFGTVYALDLHGNETTLYSFANQGDGASPLGGLALAPDGVTLLGCSESGTNGTGEIFTITTSGSLNVIHALAADGSEGSWPNGDLVVGPDKQTFYGTTGSGGENGAGTIFSVTVSGSFRNLYSFAALGSGTNVGGSNPASGLGLGSDGKLYGTAPAGGVNGVGAIFTMSTSGSFASVHDFEPNGGILPKGELTRGPDGAMYGVANEGGFNGLGSVYKLTTSGSFSVVHDFAGGGDGALPIDSAVNQTGIIAGVTSIGANSKGSLFVLPPPHFTATDYSFTGGLDGQNPTSGMVVGTDGNYYGTTSSGTASGAGGTFFKVTVTSNVLQEFDAAAGRYFGVLADGSGDVSVKLSGNGKYSGKLVADGKGYTLAGMLASTGTASETLHGAGGEFDLQLQLNNGVYLLTGTGGGQAFTALRSVYDAVGIVSSTGQYGIVIRAQAEQGMLINALPPPNPAPTGDGSATLKINRTGVVSLSGRLPDGDALRSTGLLLQGTNGEVEYPFFNSANLNGEIDFVDEATTDLTGSGNWTVAAKKNKYFPAGFTAALSFAGARYTPPARGVMAIALASGTENGMAAITGGGLAAEIDETITLTTLNKVFVSGTNGEKLRITVNAPRGTFSGSFIEPGQRRATSFSGVLYQKASAPGAFAGFLGPVTSGTAASGSVELGN